MQDNSSNALHDVTSRAADFVRYQAERGSRELGGRLHAAADELASTGDDMSQRGQDLAATLARQLVSFTRRAGDYLESADSQRMLEDAKQLARRQPWTVVVAGMLTGLALSRAMKHARPRS